MSALYGHRNLVFIGPPGVGKTHLEMAFGRECCLKGDKTYFLKATELNQRFTEAIKYGREGEVTGVLAILHELGVAILVGPAVAILACR